MFYNNIALAATGFVALANAHVFMNTPKTFAVPAVHNGPLDPTGADFPCQNRGVEYSTGGVSNVMPLGSRQPLAFTGSAVHGGGSCQISITYDTNPTKNSKWKVIHSIEGGCPVKNTPGNIGDDATMPVPFDFSFPIPDDIPTGNGTLAWTWMNRIGNREFYMNCAPITLTGNGGEKSNFEALPDMFVANIGNDCTTQEKVDYKYPNPGKSVDNFSSFGLVFPQGAGCQKALGGGGGGGGSDSGNGGAAPPPSPPAPSAAPAPAPSVPGGVFITRPTDGVAGQPTPTQAPASTQVPAPPVAEPPATTSVPPPSNSGPGSGTGGGSDGGSSGSGGAQAAGTACSSEGLWNCVNGSSYQQCASGVWSPLMPLAAGTKCSPGQSTTINIVSASGRRRRGVMFRG
ncbi:hypothetical protein V8F06_003494 [Rhypophila decipiens]